MNTVLTQKTNNIQKRVLLIMSSENKMGISGKLTGTWFEEVATPYYKMVEAGFEVVFASPKGGLAPIDLLSMKAPFTTENTERFAKDPVANFALANTVSLESVEYSQFDALFIPGGYGLLWDLASNSLVLKNDSGFCKS